MYKVITSWSLFCLYQIYVDTFSDEKNVLTQTRAEKKKTTKTVNVELSEAANTIIQFHRRNMSYFMSTNENMIYFNASIQWGRNTKGKWAQAAAPP